MQPKIRKDSIIIMNPFFKKLQLSPFLVKIHETPRSRSGNCWLYHPVCTTILFCILIIWKTILVALNGLSIYVRTLVLFCHWCCQLYVVIEKLFDKYFLWRIFNKKTVFFKMKHQKMCLSEIWFHNTAER